MATYNKTESTRNLSSLCNCDAEALSHRLALLNCDENYLKIMEFKGISVNSQKICQVLFFMFLLSYSSSSVEIRRGSFRPEIGDNIIFLNLNTFSCLS